MYKRIILLLFFIVVLSNFVIADSRDDVDFCSPMATGLDISTNLNNLSTKAGTPANVDTCVIGNCTYCDGTEYMESANNVGAYLLGANPFTMSCWLNRDGTQPNIGGSFGWGSPSDGSADVHARHAWGNNDNKPQFYNSYLSNVAIDADWFYATIQYNGTHIFLWANLTVETSIETLNVLAGKIRVCDIWTSSHHFKGWIDECTIWNRSLTLTEITDNFNNKRSCIYYTTAPIIPINITTIPINCTSCIEKANETSDLDPSVNLSTNVAGTCRSSNNTNSNFTDMGSTRDLEVTGGTGHAGSIKPFDKLDFGVQNIKVCCNSTTGDTENCTTLQLLILQVDYNITETFNPSIGGIDTFIPDWSLLNWSDTSVYNYTSGNYSWTLEEYNISYNNTPAWVFNVTNNQTFNVTLDLKMNQTDAWYNWKCNNTIINTSYQKLYSRIEVNQSTLFNCTLDLLNITQVYVFHNLTAENSTWIFDYEFRANEI